MIDLSPLFQLDFWFRLDPVGLNTVFETPFSFYLQFSLYWHQSAELSPDRKRGTDLQLKLISYLDKCS